MQPATLSASSIACFETCEARYKATYIDRGREVGGRAAVLGTCCHETLEDTIKTWVAHKPGFPSVPGPDWTLPNLINAFEVRASRHALDADAIAQGIEMMIKFFKRMAELDEWPEIMSFEVKETFILKVPALGEMPVTFIWDRGDRHPDGSIEVVDYKSYGRPMSPADLKTKVQVRLYAVSAFMKFKDWKPPFVWVTYDLLRFEPISMRFTRDECLEIYRYLQDVWWRIHESEGLTETLNSECKWCVRKAACETLHRHENVGGIIGLSIERQATLLSETQVRIAALRTLETELESQLVEHLEAEETTETMVPGARVFLKPTRRRGVDGAMVAKVIGPELAARWGNLGVTSIDKMLKEEPGITDDMRVQLKRLIRTSVTAELKVELISASDDMDEGAA